MKQRTLILLAAVTAVVVVAAFFSLRGRDAGEARASEPALLLPDLSARINDAARVTIVEEGSTATLAREDGVWTSVEAGGYPADAEKVTKTLRTLALLRVLEPMTKDPAQHGALGLDEEKGARMTVADDAGGTIADVVIGDSKYSRNGQRVYVRLADLDQTWLCEGELAPSGDPMTWVDREVARVDSARPQRVEVAHADGETLVASRAYPAQASWDVANVPEGRALSTPGAANALGTALSYLTFEEVRRAEELPLGTSHVATTTVSTFDGAVYEVRLAKIDDASWITLDARYEGVEAPVGPAPAEDAEDAGEAEDAPADPNAPPPPPDAERQEELRKETEELDARLEGWAFRIPQYKADVLAKRIDSLLAPLPETPDATTEPLEPAPAGTPEDGAAQGAAEAGGADAAPAPSEGEEPTASEGEEPASSEGEEPASSRGDEPAASESGAPTPSEGDAPAPAEGDAPIPSESDAPAPSEDDAPAPSQDDAPAPSQDDSPAPSEDDAPAPSEDDSPAQSEDDSPAQSEDDSPAQSEGKSPAA